jgi:hypothetical protein
MSLKIPSTRMTHGSLVQEDSLKRQEKRRANVDQNCSSSQIHSAATQGTSAQSAATSTPCRVESKQSTPHRGDCMAHSSAEARTGGAEAEETRREHLGEITMNNTLHSAKSLQPGHNANSANAHAAHFAGKQHAQVPCADSHIMMPATAGFTASSWIRTTAVATAVQVAPSPSNSTHNVHSNIGDGVAKPCSSKKVDSAASSPTLSSRVTNSPRTPRSLQALTPRSLQALASLNNGMLALSPRHPQRRTVTTACPSPLNPVATEADLVSKLRCGDASPQLNAAAPPETSAGSSQLPRHPPTSTECNHSKTPHTSAPASPASARRVVDGKTTQPSRSVSASPARAGRPHTAATSTKPGMSPSRPCRMLRYSHLPQELAQAQRGERASQAPGSITHADTQRTQETTQTHHNAEQTGETWRNTHARTASAAIDENNKHKCGEDAHDGSRVDCTLTDVLVMREGVDAMKQLMDSFSALCRCLETCNNVIGEI